MPVPQAQRGKGRSSKASYVPAGDRWVVMIVVFVGTFGLNR